ncbi:MAG: maleylacetoacetate isomerase [Alphaproteobacteria bacterium]|nr:MAG: maleylacetoacetate isomerase [Alphaproteobacteria bacterium]
MLKLYDYWRSSAAYRVRIGLNLKNVDYESVPINIAPGTDEQMREPYRSKNPQMRVPALETEQGIITQSLSILVWLDQTYPNPRLMPADPWLGAQVRSFATTIATDIHPLNNTSVLTRLKLEFSASEEHIGEWYRHWIKLGFNALERQVADHPDTTYVFGDEPTLADVMLVPQMANARRYKTDLTPFPRLVAWDEAARKHPAFIKAAPENQKDAVN